MKLSVGQVVADRYEVERVLGAGGTAIVYLVRDRTLDQKFAMKILSITSAAIRERMLREGKVQQGIQHPNVIRMFEVLEVDGAPALLMEYVDGPSLEQALGRYRLTMGDAETLFQGVLSGVSAAHAAGLVHRDLKPANVLLARTRDGFVPKLTDFGLAKLTEGDAAGAIGQTRSGIAMGTPSYMAPEQIRDARSVDRRADVWSLGCILYELLTRHRAFPGDEALAIYNAIVEGEFIPARTQIPEIPARLEQAIHGCLRVPLAERIPNCDTLLAVLQGVKLWPLPESTLTELSKDAPLLRPAPEPPGPPRANAEHHRGGVAGAGTGITATATALAPSMPMPMPLPRAGGGGATGGGLAAALESPLPHHEGDDAATVIVRTVDGTLVPQHTPQPHASPHARWFVGGGLLAAGLLALIGLAALVGIAVLGWLFLPPIGAAPGSDASAGQRAPNEVPARPAEMSPAPGAPPAPTPEASAPRPNHPVPAPAPAGPRAAPRTDPRPPVSADPTRQVPDTGVPDKVEVRIGTIPYAANVHVGNLEGTSPFKVPLTLSRHVVIVSAPGYEPISKLIAVSVEGPNTWCFDLLKRETTPQACP